jgi:hypothetical protein
MNHVPIACLFLSLLSTPLLAESPYERELKQLTEQRDRALASAAQPINRNYKTSLEQLLLRATQNKDLEANTKIVEALKSIGAAADVPATPASSPFPLTQRIENLLTSKVWLHGGQWHYKFTKDGRVFLEEQKRRGRFQIDGKSGFVSFLWDQKKFPGEGIQFDEATETFMHNGGGPLLPVSK